MNALILVDIQNDFVQGGALAVREGEQVVSVANRLMTRFDLVVATKDWHPSDHLSFAGQHRGRQVGEVIDLEGLPQVLWPEHCKEGTAGAEYVSGLDVAGIHRSFEKGTNRAVDSYSGFFDNGHRQATGLGDFLREQKVDEVFVMGLATDYCVKFTALDAVELGFQTHLILDGCRGVDLNPGDVDRAVEELQDAGVCVTNSVKAIENMEAR